MRILVVSDTHGNFKTLDFCVKQNLDADIIIHLGDGEYEINKIISMYPQKAIISVRGNCDYGQHELTHIAKIGNCKIFCCHGHTLAVSKGPALLTAVAKQNECNIALYGHTHIYKTEIINGVYVMNPGSPESPRSGNKPTYGIIELGADGKINMSIIELETKS